jgi:cbb3-type cytochrome oxidase maturation protein
MLFLFTGLALVLFVLAIAGLVWLVRSGQLDELDSPALRMLNDDPPPAGDERTAGGAEPKP